MNLDTKIAVHHYNIAIVTTPLHASKVKKTQLSYTTLENCYFCWLRRHIAYCTAMNFITVTSFFTALYLVLLDPPKSISTPQNRIYNIFSLSVCLKTSSHLMFPKSKRYLKNQAFSVSDLKVIKSFLYYHTQIIAIPCIQG